MRRLTTGEYARLALYGDAVRTATSTSVRNDAISVVVTVCANYHKEGVSWASLAVAVGVDADTLRRWRLASGRSTKAPGGLACHAVLAPSPPVDPGSAERRVLFATGHQSPGGNDFTTEGATIRSLAIAGKVDFVERGCIEITEVSTFLEQERPHVLHLTAHANFEGVWLVLEGEPLAVDIHTVIGEITSAAHHPPLMLLNMCDSASAAHPLATVCPCVIAWSGPVDDRQATWFSRQFYRRFFAGDSTGTSLESAQLLAKSIWPELRPVLVGSSSLTLDAATGW